jgi:hypothetical protein
MLAAASTGCAFVDALSHARSVVHWTAAARADVTAGFLRRAEATLLIADAVYGRRPMDSRSGDL